MVTPDPKVDTDGNKWLRQASSISITAADRDVTKPGGAGAVKETYYSIDDGGPIKYTGAFPLTSDGPHKVTYWSVDSDGNEETPTEAALNLDTKAPVTSAQGLGANDWVAPTDGIILDAYDPNAKEAAGDGPAVSGSGVSKTYYRIDNDNDGNFAEYTSETTLTLGGKAGGPHAIHFYSVDTAGNEEQHRSLSLNLDSVAGVERLGAEASANPAGTSGGSVVLSWELPGDIGTLAAGPHTRYTNMKASWTMSLPMMSGAMSL
jgi:hypothetical protein